MPGKRSGGSARTPPINERLFDQEIKDGGAETVFFMTWPLPGPSRFDGTTETLDELLAMEGEGRDPVAEGLIEIVGGMPLFAAPAKTAEGTLPLDLEGRYAVLCFIPQGLTDDLDAHAGRAW